MSIAIYGIVSDYLNERVVKELKDEFINAAVHFNINSDIYKKYSSLEIECMIGRNLSEKTVDYVELCSVYGYTLYRVIQQDMLNNEDKIEALQIILEISNSITSYLRATISEDVLFEKLLNITEKLELTVEQNEEIIGILNN